MSQFVQPWQHGKQVLLDGRAWDPRDCKLTVYEGPRLSTQQRSFGQGWLNAVKFGEDVTQEMLTKQLFPAAFHPDGDTGNDVLPRTRQRLTLWGNLRRLPGWLATSADLITVGGFLIVVVVGAAKLLGP